MALCARWEVDDRAAARYVEARPLLPRYTPITNLARLNNSAVTRAGLDNELIGCGRTLTKHRGAGQSSRWVKAHHGSCANVEAIPARCGLRADQWFCDAS